MLAAVAAVAAACGYGTANFLAGMASRRQPAMLTVLISQATTLLFVLAAASLSPGRPAGSGLGAAAGLLGFCGAACAYLCFSLARPVGVAAVLLGTTAAAVPVAAGILAGSRPGPAAVAGLVAAGCGLAALGWPTQTTTDTHAAVLAAAGGTR
jgi:drug/metabolite transporter (DMT)-like permease